MPEAVAPTTSIGANPIPPQTVSNMTIPATAPTQKDGAQAQDKKPVTEQGQEKKPLKLVKVDGKEMQLDEDTYHRMVQKGIGAEKRYAEAAKLMREINSKAEELTKRQQEVDERAKRFSGDVPDWDYLMEQAQGDPQKLAKVRDRAEKWLIQQLELEAASPEAQELAKQRAENDRLRKQNEDFLKKQKSDEMATLTAKHRTQLEATIMEALDVSGLPPTEWNVKHMADLMAKSIRGKYEISPQQLAAQVKQDRIENNRAIAGDYTKGILDAYQAKDSQRVMLIGAAMEELFTPELVQAVRAYDLTKLSSQQPNLPKPVVEQPIQKEASDGKRSHYMTWDEAEVERKRVVAQLDAEWRKR